MAFIIETKNPYEPYKVEKHVHEADISILEWLQKTYPGFVEFEVPTICLVNGEPLMRKDWNQKVRREDIVNFVTLVGDPLTIIAVIVAVVVIAISIALALMTPVPTTPGEGASSDPVFTLKGQQNMVRLGEPIEVCYGRNRIYPSYASRPYYQYIDNDQFQYSLFCLGQGQFEVEEVRISDTPIGSFSEASYEVVPPGSAPTLFPTSVYTASEIANQILYAANDPEVPVDGWVGPFPASSPGTTSNHIEVDVIFPKGIYFSKNNGSLAEVDIVIEGQKRLIDDAGAPLGSFTAFILETVAAKSTTPLRRTFGADVAAGRYEVRLRRFDAKSADSLKYPHRAGDEADWQGLRSYLNTTIDYGDVTLLAVKIRATNNLNDKTSQKFNVICTRKLPIRLSGGDFSNPEATRSIVWAFVDVFISLYGGRVADSFLDWDALEELDAIYESRDEHFDWVFRDPITVWEAARTVARVGRAVPLLNGSLITIKRDSLLTVPTAMFTPDNIVKGSFQWNIKLWDLDENDSVQVEYTEPDTQYKQEEVLCTLPGGTTDNPESIRIPGIQDRDHAYREGLYIRATKKYLRENISFETGMEGYIPNYGDLIAIAHDVPRWGQFGYVVHMERGVGDNYHLFVSEPLRFDESHLDYVVMFRDRRGDVRGPYPVYDTSDPQQVMVQIGDSGDSDDFDFLLGGKNEPMIFLFGVSNMVTKYAKVVKVEPKGGERIGITAVNDAPIIHSFEGSDFLAPPLLIPLQTPVEPDLPSGITLTLRVIDVITDQRREIQAMWTAAYGAQYYVLQISLDNIHWQTIDNKITTTSRNFTANFIGILYARVAAVNKGMGPWATANITVGFITGLIITNEWTNDLEWGVSWTQVSNALSYDVKVYKTTGGTTLKRTESLTAAQLSYDYNYNPKAIADSNLFRGMRVDVDVVTQNENNGQIELSGTPASLTFANAIPQAPDGLGYSLYTRDSDSATYRIFWQVPYEADLIRIKLWVSTVNGFNPASTTPVYDSTAGTPGHENLVEFRLYEHPLDSFDDHPNLYWRVGVYDVWGSENSTNISAQQTIPAANF